MCKELLTQSKGLVQNSPQKKLLFGTPADTLTKKEVRACTTQGILQRTLKALYLLVGYHGELKVNLFHNIRIISGYTTPKRLKVTYSTTRCKARATYSSGGQAEVARGKIREPDS